jgi:hypothetical protein
VFAVEVLAHQGGWDETGLVLVPIALFSGLLAMANRKAQADLEARKRGSQPDQGDPGEPLDDGGRNPG